MVSRSSADKRGISWGQVCKMAMRLPGVEQGTSYGTPALHVCKRFLARLKEDGETVAIKIDFADRDVLLELDPAAFYLTEHYRPYPAMLVRLKQVPVGLFEEVLERAWRRQAPKTLAARGVGKREKTGRNRDAGNEARPRKRGKKGRHA